MMTIYREGLLSKYAIGKSTGLTRKNWKERWFVIDEVGLRYYKKMPPKDAKKRAQSEKGCIKWTEVVGVNEANKEIHPAAIDPKYQYFCVRFVASDSQVTYTLLLRTKNHEERQQWIDEMISACGLKCNRATIKMLKEEEDYDTDDDLLSKTTSQEDSKPAGSGALLILRALVSKNKKRFVSGRFNLDLVYITDQLIAMGFPAKGKEAFYRNPVEEVEQFFMTHHPGSFRVYNLCKEREYSKSVLGGSWERFPFEDHNPPPLSLIPRCVQCIRRFLEDTENGVAAIHCKAGKGRTGTIICSYLCAYSGMTPEESLEFFGRKRTVDGKGVTIPSQKRYVHYAASLMSHDSQFPIMMTAVNIKELKFKRLHHHSQNGSDELYVLIYKRGKDGNQELFFDSRSSSTRTGNTLALQGCHGASGDLRFVVLEESRIPLMADQEMLHFWLNSAFMTDEGLTLTKKELDGPHKDKHDNTFDANFAISLVYTQAGLVQQPDDEFETTWSYDKLGTVKDLRPRGNAFVGSYNSSSPITIPSTTCGNYSPTHSRSPQTISQAGSPPLIH